MPKSKKTDGASAPAGAEKPEIMKKKKSISKSEKSGLTFPVARLNKYMKKYSNMKRVGGSAPVFMTAVAEYITAEIMEQAGNITSAAGRKTVSADDLSKAMRSDKELAKLFTGHGIFVGDKIGKVTDAITYVEKEKKPKATEAAE